MPDLLTAIREFRALEERRATIGLPDSELPRWRELLQLLGPRASLRAPPPPEAPLPGMEAGGVAAAGIPAPAVPVESAEPPLVEAELVEPDQIVEVLRTNPPAAEPPIAEAPRAPLLDRFPSLAALEASTVPEEPVEATVPLGSAESVIVSPLVSSPTETAPPPAFALPEPAPLLPEPTTPFAGWEPPLAPEWAPPEVAPAAPPMEPMPLDWGAPSAVAPPPAPDPVESLPAFFVAPPEPTAAPLPANPIPEPVLLQSITAPGAPPPTDDFDLPALAPEPPAPSIGVDRAQLFGELRPPSVVPGEHRVVVHMRAGLLKRGLLREADLEASELELEVPSGNAGPERIPLTQIKAIFFMLEPGAPPPAQEGQKVTIEFEDGRRLVGFCGQPRPSDPGFFLVPADIRSNTARIYVRREAIKSLES
ncbi:MAG: DUF6982 domain-containing protein [Deltaproteobacteria bacterium]